MHRCLLTAGFAIALVAAGACAGEVLDQRSSPVTDGDTSTESTPPMDDPGPVDASAFDPEHISCPEPSGSCSSAAYPAGETCYECSCRCCAWPSDESACLADAACIAWLDCLRGCEGGEPCAAGCPPPCETGLEPACLLVDCHDWVCSHACGTTG